MFADPNHYVPQALLDKDLTGKTAIVTGATGSFGSIISETLVKQGANDTRSSPNRCWIKISRGD
jgi:FlaA1/EpsC-like NDP-sugar epimerase